jgi:hypothetical protein
VRAAVQKKARQGVDLARGGLERLKETAAHLKETTTHLIEGMKERITGGEGGQAEVPPAPDARDAAPPR